MGGPVFSMEVLMGGRRSRLAFIRRVLAACVIAQVGLLFAVYFLSSTRSYGPGTAQFLDSCFRLIVLEHFLLLFIATPAFMAGAIADEKSKGTIQYLLTTDLKSSEIVLQKLAGRAVPLAFLGSISLPPIAFLAGYGQRGVVAFLAAVLISILVVFALGAVSLWISVCCRQTRDAALRVYILVGVLALLVWGTPEFGIPLLKSQARNNAGQQLSLIKAEDALRSLDPLFVVESAWKGNRLDDFGRHLLFMVPVYGLAAALCLGLAIWRLRAATISQIERVGRKTGRLIRRHRVDDDPIRWREQTAGAGWKRWLAAGTIAAVTSASSYWIVGQRDEELFLVQGVVAAFMASMLVGIRASGSVTGEREARTWESLLFTPLDTWDLVVEKQLGVSQWFYPFFFAFALPEIIVALSLGMISTWYVVCTLFVAWVAMYYMAATGVWWSVSSTSSWRSLVGTMATGYGYVLLIMVVVAFLSSLSSIPLALALASMLGLSNFALGWQLARCATTVCILAWFLWRASQRKMSSARRWIDAEEREGRTMSQTLTRALRKIHERDLERASGEWRVDPVRRSPLTTRHL
jgi:ABC-type transport system involved in multi-copper enzyme maturation permease subunit